MDGPFDPGRADLCRNAGVAGWNGGTGCTVQKLAAKTRKQTSPKQTSDAPNRCLKRRAKTVPKPCQNNATRAHPPIRCTPVGTPCTRSSQHAAQARALLLAAAGQARERSFKPITLRPTRAFLTTHPRTIASSHTPQELVCPHMRTRHDTASLCAECMPGAGPLGRGALPL